MSNEEPPEDFQTAYQRAVEKETEIRDTSFLCDRVPWEVCEFKLRWLTPIDYKILEDSGNAVLCTSGECDLADVAAFLFYLRFGAKQYEAGTFRLARAQHKFMREVVRSFVIHGPKLLAECRKYLADQCQDQPQGDGAWRPLPTSWLVILVDMIAHEYRWKESAIVRKPLARLYQYLKLIQQRNDPHRPMFNPSDSVKNRLMQS